MSTNTTWSKVTLTLDGPALYRNFIEQMRRDPDYRWRHCKTCRRPLRPRHHRRLHARGKAPRCR